MATAIHTILSLTVLSAINCLIYFQASSLIGFIHGPLAQIAAQNKYELTNTFLNEQESTDCDAYDTAYEDASLPRDAGMIASFFTMILIVLPGFLSYNFTKRQCASFILLVPLLCISPGLISQILSAQIPIELSFFRAFGLNGIGMAEKCSIRNLVTGWHNLSSLVGVAVYEMKLVGLAAFVLFLVLGIMPIEK